MNKKELRERILEKRNQLLKNEVHRASEAIIKKLLDSVFLHSAKVIFSYMPYGKEVDIAPLNQWVLDQGKILCVPRVKNSIEMEAVAVKSLQKEMVRSSFGILEPAAYKEAFVINQIDLIFVPGLAFDKTGNRMGYGGGYYDRFLAQCSAHTVFWGIGYAFQVLDSIPATQYDMRVHRIITD